MEIKLFCTVIIGVLLGIACGDSTSEPPKLDFQLHFNALAKKRYPLYDYGEPWITSRKYIKERMRHYGSRDIHEQKFTTTVESHDIEGVNLIAIAEGQNTDSNGSVIVVGADYDTNIISNQLKDNTGGVAVLLETMHLFFDKVYWNLYYQNFTVIFVAFDLNTREYRNNGMGLSGSYFFIHDWLIPYLDNETNPQDFRGAIILDSVTTYNVDNNTQTLREGFEDAMPKANEDIKSRGMKGDFLGFLYTSNEEQNPIKQTFFMEYYKDRKLNPYRLQEMEVHLKYDLIGKDVLEMINHQSHYYFWTNAQGRYLPSFLLFDTDEDRVDPTPDACSIINCSVEQFLTDERIDFMTKTTQTLLNTLRKLQTTYVEPPPSAATTTSSPIVLLLTALSFILTFLLKNH